MAILSTGDELIMPGTPITPGKIYESNGQMIGALVEEAGGIPEWLGIAGDCEACVQDLLDQAIDRRADLILSSAGVSEGVFDYVRSVIEKHGHLDFWRVNMRPGKPIVFGDYRGKPFFGLPGNPVSAFVGFLVFVWPALGKLAGCPTGRRMVKARDSEEIQSDGRESYLRAIVEADHDGALVARLTGHQGSGNLFSLVQANAILIVPSGVKSVRFGEEVDAFFLM